jgi:hypothetical protein
MADIEADVVDLSTGCAIFHVGPEHSRGEMSYDLTGCSIDLTGATVCVGPEHNVGLGHSPHSPKLAKYLAWAEKNPGPYVTWQVAPDDEFLQSESDAFFVDQDLFFGNQRILVSVLVPVGRACDMFIDNIRREGRLGMSRRSRPL